MNHAFWKSKVKLRERKAVWLCNRATGWYILYDEQGCKHVMIHNPKACQTASVCVLVKNRTDFASGCIKACEFERLSLLLSRQVHPDGVWRPPGPVSVRGERGRDMVSQQEAGRRPGSCEQPRCPAHTAVISCREGHAERTRRSRRHWHLKQTESSTRRLRGEEEKSRVFTSWNKNSLTEMHK